MNFKQPQLLIKKFRYEIIAVFFTAYGMYLRFICLLNREFWSDEIISLQLLQGPFKPIWQRLYYTDLTYFPGEYIINWPFVYFFKVNKWGIAIPHILLTLLGFYLLYLICRRYFHSIFAWIATFTLVAVHRDLIFHSFELRPYAVLPTLALAVFYFTEEIVSKYYSLSWTRKILIGFCFIFTIIFHVYGAIILFFTFIYFLLRESGGRTFGQIFKHIYRFMLVIVIIGLLLYLWYSVGNSFVINGMGCNIFQYVPNPIVDFFAFVKCNLCNLVGKKILYPLAVFLIFPFLLPQRARLQQIGFLLILVILPLMVILYFDILIRYWFLQRQFIWVMPLFAFLIGWCIDSFIGFMRQKIGENKILKD